MRIALASGLTHTQIASDLGIGMSQMNKWITAHPLTGNGLQGKPCKG